MLFINQYLFTLLTNIIIHDSVQMALVSKQMCDTVILKGALQLILTEWLISEPVFSPRLFAVVLLCDRADGQTAAHREMQIAIFSSRFQKASTGTGV